MFLFQINGNTSPFRLRAEMELCRGMNWCNHGHGHGHGPVQSFSRYNDCDTHIHTHAHSNYMTLTVHKSVPKEMSYTCNWFVGSWPLFITGLFNFCDDPPLPIAGKLPVHVWAMVDRQPPTNTHTCYLNIITLWRWRVCSHILVTGTWCNRMLPTSL